MTKLSYFIIKFIIFFAFICQFISYNQLSYADIIPEIKKKNEIIFGIKDNVIPFGYLKKIDKKTRILEGYDIDFANEIANRLNVKPVFKAVTSSTRIPLLIKKEVDILICTMTITSKRKEEIDFSHQYFVSKQKFLVHKGTVNELKDLDGKIIITSKGSTAETNTKKYLPKATILGLEDYSQAAHALYLEKIFAITTDESVLAGILSNMKSKSDFQITNFDISSEPYGIGVRKNSDDLLKLINDTLEDMEKSGRAKEIFNKWFGPDSLVPLTRDFKIEPANIDSGTKNSK
ncbi:transporter substrate-binding domain-containing protein [Pigmentibacter ruber]